MSMVHYLLVYDHDAGRLREQHLFLDSDEAVAAYADLERLHRYDRRLEIVLVSAESLDVIMRTHAHYFMETIEPLEMPLNVG